MRQVFLTGMRRVILIWDQAGYFELESQVILKSLMSLQQFVREPG
jgi:hypothetical protein